MDNTASEFGEKLRGYRERLGLLQKELAEGAGLSPSHLTRIEKGARKPPQVDTVLRMVAVLRLSPDEAEEFVRLAGYSTLVLQNRSLSEPETHIDGYMDDESEKPVQSTGKSVVDDAFYFPYAGDLEAELLAEAVRQVIQAPGLSKEKREQNIQLLRSFLDWLKYREEN
jgi:transcriptional regulator with XRE-family HTH domain